MFFSNENSQKNFLAKTHQEGPKIVSKKIFFLPFIDALTVTGDVEEGLPSWQLPWKFNLDTTNSTLGPIEMAEEFGIGLLMLPLVSMLQHLAIAKFYTRKYLLSEIEK